jgi:hypothetical protein
MYKTYTFSDQLVSDLHKDAYGYRPSEAFWLDWSRGTDDDRQSMWDDLLWAVDYEVALGLEAERCVREFEEEVAANLSRGADTRLIAVSWVLDARGANFLNSADAYGADWMRYELGLPYSYEDELAAAYCYIKSRTHGEDYD